VHPVWQRPAAELRAFTECAGNNALLPGRGQLWGEALGKHPVCDGCCALSLRMASTASMSSRGTRMAVDTVPQRSAA